ncbi:hypothetical protein SFRURICE_003676 [Spodoptera frugiperda]|nr:hypothetical protein SFRURICE_003676 [Spodoptera frugiperda]
MRLLDAKEGGGAQRLSKLPQPQASPPCRQVLARQGEPPKRRGSAARRRSGSGASSSARKRAAALLLAPKTAAVVITLQPDAVQKGVTYGDVLAKLKGAVTPAEFGAPDGFSMKVTATGARLLEVPGAASGSSADALAERN